MADALSGAPVHAKETVLKILERLTQRLDRAERDRDLALGRYRELQARYEQLEEELSKKRGELRELLRQDSRSFSVSQTNGRHGGESPGDTGRKVALSVIVEAGAAEEERLSQSQASVTSSSPTKQEQVEPEQKSPAKPAEPSPSPGAAEESLPPPRESASPVEGAVVERSNTIEQELNKKLKVRSQVALILECLFISSFQDSDYLTERMIKMEAELTALKEELSTRSKPNSEAGASTTGPETNPASENTSSVIKKTENNIKDEN